MFIMDGMLKETELEQFFDKLEGKGLSNPNPYELDNQMMSHMGEIVSLWEQLRSIDNKNFKLGDSLKIRMHTSAEKIRQEPFDPSVAFLTTSPKQIDELFPGASQDFKDLTLYLGIYIPLASFAGFKIDLSPSQNPSSSSSNAQAIIQNNPLWQTESTDEDASAQANHLSTLASKF
ncbi:MAG: hypothetical protein WC627_06700 [Legionella sp.]|jgi:hypothetical protein